MSIVLDKSITEQEKAIIDTWFTCDVNTGVVYNGMHVQIPLDRSLIVRDHEMEEAG